MYATTKNHEIIHAYTRYCTHPGSSFVTLKGLCNNQRPRKSQTHYNEGNDEQ